MSQLITGGKASGRPFPAQPVPGRTSTDQLPSAVPCLLVILDRGQPGMQHNLRAGCGNVINETTR
jgi:hypothetical protein